MRRWALVPLVVTVVLAVLAACGAPSPAPTATTVPAAPAATTVATAAVASPAATVAKAPELAGLELVEKATIRIVAKGTFIDPKIGLVPNAAGTGSGFMISADGLAVTANHVVTGAATLDVFIGGDPKPKNARVVAATECSDLAVIDVEGQGYPFLRFSETPFPVGTPIYVAGFPLGEPQYALVSGIISKADAGGESIWASVKQVIQHDALANPGNSGGPVVTRDGQVVGIHYATRPDAKQGFAIGSAVARPLIESLKAGKNIDWIGINGQAVSGGGLSGIWVASIESGSPADKAGLKPGDIITHLERLALATDGTMKDYCNILRTKGSDKAMQVQALRTASGDVLEGQVNGAPLALVQAAAPKSTTAAATPTAKAAATPAPPATVQLVDVSDDTGVIKARVPSTWSIAGKPGASGVPILFASPDLFKFIQGIAAEPKQAGTTGVVIAVAKLDPGSPPIDPKSLTEGMKEYPRGANCAYAESQETGANAAAAYWTGDLLECDHGGRELLVFGAAHGRKDVFIIFDAVALTKEDGALIEQIFETLQIVLR